MRKILKKIKIKHLARVGLVSVLLIGILSMLCAFTYPLSIVIDKTETPSYGYTINDVSLETSQFTNNVFTEVVDTAPAPEGEFNTLLKVYEGSIYMCNPTGQVLEEWIALDEGGTLSDGYYKAAYKVIRTGNVGDDDTDFVVEGVDTYSSLTSDSQLLHFYSSADINGTTLKFVSAATEFETEPIAISCYILVPTEPLPVTEPITSVWSGVLSWFASSINSITGLFWDGSSFTFFGIAMLITSGITLVLIIVNKIKDFLHLQ